MASRNHTGGSALEIVRQHARALKDITHLAVADIPLDAFFARVTVLVADAIEIDHTKVMRYRPDTDDLLIVAGVGWRDGVVGHVAFATSMNSPPGRAFQTGMPVCIIDESKSTEFVLSPTLKAHGIVALLNVPVMIDGAAWGVLEVDSTVPRDFSIDTQDFLTTVGAIVGAGILREQVSASHARMLENAALETRRTSMLLSEMQHRVKNNFQLILSMITSMRARMQPELFEKLSDNIIAMSLAHAQLNPGQSGEAVHLPTYLRALAARLQHMSDTVTTEVHVDEHAVPVERAVPLGLIVNELVTNCVKHAFDERGGVIIIKLQAVGSDFALTVSDNGVGAKPAAPAGSGLRLVEALARQLRGTVEMRTENPGMTTCILFPRV
jgi:two-component sensor histidine kinase